MIINVGSLTAHPGLRGHTTSTDTLSDIDLSLSDFKMNACKLIMDKCSEIIRDDKACYTPGNCNDAYKKFIMPITHSFCSFSSDQCDDLSFDEALDKLYSAGALTFNMEDTKNIDEKIKELNELKHKVKMVSLSSHAEEAKKAREKYLQDRSESHKIESKTSKGAEETEKKLDEETPTV
ncbi:uncharacterized protein TA15805 [Theileria annulata]|uniref:Uncharacterized protein n=1 Tax=Theileria annulata TaxID=5874 RepID=Q4UFP4_THEAN|nr:uncharacterized protein TA15805 [Theileria annulata]CAI74072.1 hypothetical protein TA15805 [Theileria annulata]|eukprot:XP_951804.1 hypothetical protein TA15805 [Theileria annulata]